MCTYNGATHVRAQLESIFNQTEPPDEVIISDDVSSDDTLEIVGRVTAGRVPAVRVLRNPSNLRVNGNFERAIAHATGEVIFTSDQDDVWLPHRIARMVEPMRHDAGIDAVYCDAIVTDAALVPAGETLFSGLSHFHIGRRRSASEVLRGVEVRGCTLAFRARLKEYILPIPDPRYWGWDYWIVLLASALGIVHPLPEPLMYYRRHGGNRSPLLQGWLGDLRSGFSDASASADAYARDTGRWIVAHERLQEILAAQQLTADQRVRAEAFCSHVDRRLRLAQVRERAKHQGFVKRLPGALATLLRGDYHRYKRGVKTLAKDILVR